MVSNASSFILIMKFLLKEPDQTVFISEKEIEELDLVNKEITWEYDFDKNGWIVKLKEIEKDGLQQK